jgi:hypothetical protein
MPQIITAEARIIALVFMRASMARPLPDLPAHRLQRDVDWLHFQISLPGAE